MKRSLTDNLTICAIGLFCFWLGNLAYTICKYQVDIDAASCYFICNAFSYVFLSYGLLKIASTNKIIKSIFAMFLFLSIANLFDELLFMATKFDIREYWYSAAIVGFFTTKIIHLIRERN